MRRFFVGLLVVVTALPLIQGSAASATLDATVNVSTYRVPTADGLILHSEVVAAPNFVSAAVGDGIRSQLGTGTQVDLYPPLGQRFVAGTTYQDLRPTHSLASDAAHALAYARGWNHSLCFSIAIGGTLQVLDVAYDATGSITSFAAHMTLPCSLNGPNIDADIRFHSAMPLTFSFIPEISLGSSAPAMGATRTQGMYVINGGTTPVTLGAASVSGVPAGWTVTADLSGCPPVLAAGARCLGHVTYTSGGSPIAATINVATPDGQAQVMTARFYAGDAFPLTAPVVRTRSSFDGIGLLWDRTGQFPLTHDYAVYRRLAGGAWTQLPFTFAGGLHATDLTLAAGQSAEYMVGAKAIGSGEQKSAPVTVSRSTFSPSPTVGSPVLALGTADGAVAFDHTAGADPLGQPYVGFVGLTGLIDGPGTYPIPGSVTINQQFQNCTAPAGTLTVREAVLNASGAPYRLDASLNLTCLDGQALRGEVRVGTANLPFAAVSGGVSFQPPPVVYVGAHAAGSVSLFNGGNAAATLTPATIAEPSGSGAPWSVVDHCPATLAPGATCTMDLAFTPTVSWSGSTTLTIPGVGLFGSKSVTLSANGQVDATPPSVVTLLASPAFTLYGDYYFSPNSTDTGTGVRSYDFQDHYVRYSSNAFRAWNYPSSWQNLTDVTGFPSFAPAPGFEYCVSARARDAVGNTSEWSPDQCTERVQDDPALVSVGSLWTRTLVASSDHYYGASFASTASHGARLTGPTVYAKRVAVVGVTCPTCGSVQVFVGTTLIGTVSLYSSSVHYESVLALPIQPAVRAGALSLVVSSTNKPVIIDGFGASLS